MIASDESSSRFQRNWRFVWHFFFETVAFVRSSGYAFPDASIYHRTWKAFPFPLRSWKRKKRGRDGERGRGYKSVGWEKRSEQ